MQYLFFAFLTGLYAFLLATAPLSPITLLLGLPTCVWISNLLHETAHLLSYRCLSIPWHRLRISCFLIRKEQGKLSFALDWQSKLYEAECTCLYDARIPAWKYCISLLNGGLSCAIACPVFIFLSLPLTSSVHAFLLCLGIAFGLNATVNLIYPRSTDRLLIKRFLKERR